jgi:PGF-pre-PGF domain-containing protein
MKTKLIAISLLALLLPSVFALVFPKETLFFDRLNQDIQVKLIDNEEILFMSLGISTIKDITRARITVQAMPDCPENAPYQANVLQCFFITAQQFGDEEIKEAEITFSVPKEWISANNYNSVELRRYSYAWNENLHGTLSRWKALKTNLVNEDQKYAYFKAESDGIYYFSIVGVKNAVNYFENKIIEDEGTLDEDEAERNSNEITANVVKEAVIEAPKTPNYSWFFLLVFATILMLSSAIKQSPFEQLTDYIRESKTSEEETRSKLKEAGWEDWQIELGFNEAKRPK